MCGQVSERLIGISDKQNKTLFVRGTIATLLRHQGALLATVAWLVWCGMWHGRTPCRRLFYRAPWMVVDTPVARDRTGERTSRSGLVFPSMTWSLLSKTGVSLSTVDTIDILIIPLPQRLEKRINKSISLVKLYSLPTPNFPRTQSDTACSLPPNTIHYMAATRYAG